MREQVGYLLGLEGGEDENGRFRCHAFNELYWRNSLREIVAVCALPDRLAS